jgi:hypothetical protein
MHPMHPDPDIGLNVLDQMADVDRAISIRQSGCDEQAAGSGGWHKTIERSSVQAEAPDSNSQRQKDRGRTPRSNNDKRRMAGGSQAPSPAIKSDTLQAIEFAVFLKKLQTFSSSFNVS